MLELINGTKIFNLGTVNENVALQEINLKLEKGEFVTVIGSNGAGKSTLLNVVAGSLLLDQGEILINNNNLTGCSDYQRANLVSRVFQDPLQGTAASMTIAENLVLALKRGAKRGLNLGVTNFRRKRFKEELSILNLGLEDRLDDKVGLLSGGQRQALTLVMATIQSPEVLLLDEHTAALDPETARQIIEITKELVNKNKLTTLMVTHDLNQALELGTRTIMMDQGEIILDIGGQERDLLTVSKLLDKFAQVSGQRLANDKILLAQ